MRHIFTIVIIFSISFIGVFAETISSEPLEIWANESDGDNEENNISLDADVKTEITQPIISQTDISYSAYDTIGFYDQTSDGFNPAMWENSNFESVKFLIDQLSVNYQSNSISNLLDKTLLSISTPPKKNEISSQSFLDLKMEYYLQYQNDNVVKKILDQVSLDDWTDYDVVNYINHYLISGNHKYVCVKKYLNRLNDLKTKLIYQTFCKAMSNNLPATDLSLSLLQEQGQIDKEFLYIMNSYINGQEIDLKNIKFINLIKLSLINNKNIDFSELVSLESDVSIKKYYALSNLKNTETKIRIIEELIKKNILNSDILSSSYKNYLIDNDIFPNIEYKNARNDLEKRVFLYSQIRNDSDQKSLVTLTTNFINEMKTSDMLYSSNNLIYDKIKVIQPKTDYSNQVLDVCIVLIINGDNERCREWSQIIKFNKSLNDEYSLIEYFLYLNSASLTKEFNKETIENIILSNKISEFNKNIIVKHIEITSKLKFPDYWKSKSKLNKVSAIVPNIRLIEYLKNASNNNIGEAALLILILNGDKKFSELDDFSIFAILEALNKIDPETMKKLIFEISLKNINL
ncbi:hypothetical protein OAD84_01330 [Pelagibacterales bacterium]|nr:hypothetical protein [Pelagibacterales bacterium]